MKIEADGKTLYRENQARDPYFLMFLNNSCLRKSCFNCPSRGLYERADITLGDFLGVELIAPDLVDGGGVSLVTIHSEKGKKIFDTIVSECSGHEIDFDKAIKGNYAFFESYKKPIKRTQIEHDINKDFYSLFWKYGLSKKGKIRVVLEKLHLNWLITILKRLKKQFKK